MKKIVTILFLFVTVVIGYAAQDSSAVAVKKADTLNTKTTAVDSTKLKDKKIKSDSSLVKTKTDTASSKVKPDSVQRFVDKNGDGFNDNAPDHDGDGIPDALDKDYWALKEKDKTKPDEGTPPKVLGLDRMPGKVLPDGKPEQDKSKPGIKFDMRGRRGKR